MLPLKMDAQLQQREVPVLPLDSICRCRPIMPQHTLQSMWSDKQVEPGDKVTPNGSSSPIAYKIVL
jgi:hypothetical protein